MSSIDECIQNGSCKAIFYSQDGCPHCPELRDKLDGLGIDYEERKVTQEILDTLDRETVPFLQINDRITGQEVIIENDDVESIRRKIYEE